MRVVTSSHPLRTIDHALRGVVALTLAGCGLSIRSADLFLLTRTGPTGTLTLEVSDGGTVRCNGGSERPLPGGLLIQARMVAADLDADARHNLTLPTPPGSVHHFTVRLENGTVSFPDTAAARHRVLGETELLATQIGEQVCRATG